MFEFTMINIMSFACAASLSHSDYTQRHVATREIQHLGPFCLLYLHLTNDLESKRRSFAIENTYYNRRANYLSRAMKPQGWTKLPWIDSHPNWNSGNYQRHLRAARAQIKKPGQPHWPEYRLATQLMLQELIRARASTVEVQQLLDRMAYGDVQWIQRNGKRYQIEISTVP